MRKTFALLMLAASIVSSGCPDKNPFTQPTIANHWNFTMGNRGPGTISFSALGPVNGAQSGECTQPACPATVEDLAMMRLTPRPTPNFTFKFWDGDPLRNLVCPLGSQAADGTLSLTVTRDGACYAVFVDTSTTVPGPGRR